MPVAGPIGHSVDDLAAFMQIVASQNPWKYDPSCLQIPWNTTGHFSRPLRIGVLPEDSEYTLQPPVKRALESAATKLQEAGHTIIRLAEDESRSIGLGARIAFASYAAGQPSHEALAQEMGEPLVNSLAKGVHPFSKHPPPVTRDMGLIETVAALGAAKEAYAGSWHKTWVENDLDIVIAPGAQHTAVPYDEYGVPAYTCAWNVVDVSAFMRCSFGTSGIGNANMCPVSCMHRPARPSLREERSGCCACHCCFRPRL